MFLRCKKQVKTCTHTETSDFIMFFPTGKKIRCSFSVKGKIILFSSNKEQYRKHKYIQ